MTRADEAELPVRDPAVRAGAWTTVASRPWGVTVHRVTAGPVTYYVKATPADLVDPRLDATREAERLRWAAAHGLPVPEVVEVGADERHTWLVTVGLPGRAASAGWSADELGRVVDAVADLAVALHSVPVADCPFDRGLAGALAEVDLSVRTGMVDLDDLDPPRVGWSVAQLQRELLAEPKPDEDDPVVCHGDLCLDNVLVDPDRLTVSGLIDPARLGVADRWLDLAVILPDICDNSVWGRQPQHADRFLRRYGLPRIAAEKFAYYQLVDEFM